jgi:Uma2 family endonuclease
MPLTIEKPPIANGRRMSEAEFVRWAMTSDVRAEWVNGEVVVMHAVKFKHADFAQFLVRLIGGFVEAHDLGGVYFEPYHVRLPGMRRRRSPDLFFVSAAKQKFIQEDQFQGAPELIIEILSADSQTRDRTVKFAEYEKAGVGEYWLVDPRSRSFEAYTPGKEGRYQQIAAIDQCVRSVVLPGLFFKTEWVYQLRLPKVAPLLRQMNTAHRKLGSTRKPRRSDNRS